MGRIERLGHSSVKRRFHVYIMSNVSSSVLYIGMSGGLEGRVKQHKDGVVEGFSKRYKTNRLVYIEEFATAREAIEREKQLKRWRREWKDELIDSVNPRRKDLAANWFENGGDGAGEGQD